MNCDSYFEPANQNPLHPCQDYALSGVVDDLHYGIIADGCSSSKHSEVGAQILCHVAKHFLLLFHKSESDLLKQEHHIISNLLKESISKRADEIRSLYDINQDAIDATLWIVYNYEGYEKGPFYVFGWGDGYLIHIEKNDEILFRSFEYESGAPYYLSYNCSNTRNEMYKNEFGTSNLMIRSSSMNDNTIVIDRKEYDKSFSTVLYNAKAVIVFSDGLGSYLNSEKDSVRDRDMIPKITGYKRIIGEFMKSNMIFLKRQNLKDEITHYDDISCAAIVKGL